MGNLIEKAIKKQPSSVLPQSSEQEKSLEQLRQEQNLDLENSDIITEETDIYEFSSFGIKIDTKYPQKMAVIVIENDEFDQESIIINCYHGALKLSEQLTTESFKAPNISYAKIAEDMTKIGRMYGIIRGFSKKHPQAKQLRGWLLKLQGKLENQLSYLVINDRTNFEIPWELVELKQNQHIGANLVTVRWQDITDPDNLDEVDSLIDLKIEEHNCCGNIVAYLNTKDLPKVREEKKTIEPFNPIVHENIYNFLDFLDTVDLDVSLVFIASHGFLGNNISETMLGEENEKQQISLPDLYAYDFDCLANCSSLVFMNSCHSGRLQTDESFNIFDSDERVGFSTFFLEKGANGVIGTLCQVADLYAAKVAKNFFDECQQNPQLPVATILKNMRCKAIENYLSEKNRDNQRLFLFTFLYIYYGNPMTKLKLIAKEGN
ncbi:CHAT domain-containing protein [Crocosphaera sp.]|uniref:CHAT domain-containing protein n=1 Tax=Crocosphaera sp. TaxID=2729996 RepID=UPI003F28A5A5|nr:CHAT domain-containing protein [Crocosphaera sp.]